MKNATPINDYQLSIDDIESNIDRLANKLNALQYEFLLLVREFDERAGWLRSGSKNCAQWLEWRCDLSSSAAREKVRVALALKDLGAISEAFSRGALAYSKVRALTRIATAENESELLAMASRLSAAQVDQFCRQKRNASKESMQIARQAQNQRNYRSWPNHDRGMVTITVELPTEEAALFEKALEKAAQDLDSAKLGGATAPDEQTSWGTIQADAVVNLAKCYLTPGMHEIDSDESSPSRQANSAADNYQVMIHVDDSALTGQGGSSDLPIETVKRLCCDGSIIGITEGDNGEPLSIGRKQRTVTTAIRRALWARDGGCIYPGCGHTRFVDVHHAVHWADGGETSLKNCLLLCSAHHKQVHEGAFTLKADYAGQWYFTRRDGRVVPNSGYRVMDWQDTGVNCEHPRLTGEGATTAGLARETARETAKEAALIDSAESIIEGVLPTPDCCDLVKEPEAAYCVVH